MVLQLVFVFGIFLEPLVKCRAGETGQRGSVIIFVLFLKIDSFIHVCEREHGQEGQREERPKQTPRRATWGSIS